MKMRQRGHGGVRREADCGTDLEGLRGGDADGGGHSALPGADVASSHLDVCRQRRAKVPAVGAGFCGGCVVVGGRKRRGRSVCT